MFTYNTMICMHDLGEAIAWTVQEVERIQKQHGFTTVVSVSIRIYPPRENHYKVSIVLY